jgi:hypothetical protein
MSCPRLLAALAAFACFTSAQAVELAQPDDALVQRFMQHPEELAARVDECARMTMAEAVGSAVCVSTKEARYQRERAVLRTTKGTGTAATATFTSATPAPTHAALVTTSKAPTSAATTPSTSTAPAGLPSIALVAQANDRP